MISHVQRYHRHYRSSGHVWQGRVKSFPIEQDGHLLTVLRYIVNQEGHCHGPGRCRDFQFQAATN